MKLRPQPRATANGGRRPILVRQVSSRQVASPCQGIGDDHHEGAGQRGRVTSRLFVRTDYSTAQLGLAFVYSVPGRFYNGTVAGRVSCQLSVSRSTQYRLATDSSAVQRTDISFVTGRYANARVYSEAPVVLSVYHRFRMFSGCFELSGAGRRCDRFAVR